MENLVVTTFKDIVDATEGLNKIKELDKLGDITIYNILMVRKGNDKQYQLLYHEGVEIDNLPLDDQLADLLRNTLDRPIRMVTDIFSGIMKEAGNKEESEHIFNDFLAQFNKELQLGTYSIFLDIEEDSIAIIDDYMSFYHGVSLRSNIVDLYHKYVEDQWMHTYSEIEQEQNALESAEDDKKAEIQNRIDKERAEREKLIGQLKIWVNKIRNQLDARLRIIERKSNIAGSAIKPKLKIQKDRLEQKVKVFNNATTFLFNRSKKNDYE